MPKASANSSPRTCAWAKSSKKPALDSSISARKTTSRKTNYSKRNVTSLWQKLGSCATSKNALDTAAGFARLKANFAMPKPNSPLQKHHPQIKPLRKKLKISKPPSNASLPLKIDAKTQKKSSGRPTKIQKKSSPESSKPLMIFAKKKSSSPRKKKVSWSYADRTASLPARIGFPRNMRGPMGQPWKKISMTTIDSSNDSMSKAVTRQHAKY